ncbi:MAG: hypothetical protein BGO98_39890 [Myxococcales bacterium 68-20]|nr:sigma-70 family RNA polymerase sigma factor [Myxococcales bacterium]OJY19266.1 MAG: hypothetical protein BGO98_39890 [Myxococcales bacterium 68-20]
MEGRSTNAEALSDNPEVDDAVRHAVATVLTPKQREAVELFFFEGFSQSEIARRLGVSQQVIQKRIFGAQRRGVFVGGAVAKLRKVLAPLASRTTGATASSS